MFDFFSFFLITSVRIPEDIHLEILSKLTVSIIHQLTSSIRPMQVSVAKSILFSACFLIEIIFLVVKTIGEL